MTTPISRKDRVAIAKENILDNLDEKQKEFLEFVLEKYVEGGVEELAEDKLPSLLKLKYHAIADAEKELGGVDQIRVIFFGFQKKLYYKTKIQ